MRYTRDERAYIGALELLTPLKFHQWYGCSGPVSYSIAGDDELDREKKRFLEDIC